jgi:26S proteasome regulatory subunit N1
MVRAAPHPIGRSADVLINACAWAGTGNVLKVQKMLQICSEHGIDFDKEDEKAEQAEAEAKAQASAKASAEGNDAPVLAPAADDAMAIDTDAAPPSDSETATLLPAAEVETAPAPAPAEPTKEELRAKAEEKQAKEMKKQSMAVIGIALIAMGEEVGAEMALRHFQHLVSSVSDWGQRVGERAVMQRRDKFGPLCPSRK